MAKIHNGFFDKRFHDTFKNSNINDTDIATTKFYNRPKYLYEHLGFDGIVYDKPDEPRYWQNIIPKNYLNIFLTCMNTKSLENLS